MSVDDSTASVGRHLSNGLAAAIVSRSGLARGFNLTCLAVVQRQDRRRPLYRMLFAGLGRSVTVS